MYGIRERPNRSMRPPQPGGPVSEESNGECRQCGERVFWIKSSGGKNVACNPLLKVHDVPIFDETGKRQPKGYGRICHWGTCTKDRAEPSGVSESQSRSMVLAAVSQTFTLEELRAMRTDLSRLVGIMDKLGVDPDSPRRVRTMLLDAMQRGWGAS